MYRFGLVRYLNTSPFRYGLRELGGAQWIDEVPSRLLPLLMTGQVDAAILPSLDVLSQDDLSVLSDTCIACRGPAYSVKLFSRIPLRHVASVALDNNSHTSSALTRIIMELQEFSPTYVEMAPDLDNMLAHADAALLIGDSCMQADASGLLVTDLGEEWGRLTGLPFVFALWAPRPELDTSERRVIGTLIEQAKNLGLQQVEHIAREESVKLGLPKELIRKYLTQQMRYDLDFEYIRGLERFRRLAAAQGLIKDAGPIWF